MAARFHSLIHKHLGDDAALFVIDELYFPYSKCKNKGYTTPQHCKTLDPHNKVYEVYIYVFDI